MCSTMVGGGRRLAAVGGWQLAVGGGWRLAVGGPLGRSLRAVLSKQKKSVPEPVFPKKPAGTPCAQPWLVGVGSWRFSGQRKPGTQCVSAKRLEAVTYREKLRKRKTFRTRRGGKGGGVHVVGAPERSNLHG